MEALQAHVGVVGGGWGSFGSSKSYQNQKSTVVEQNGKFKMIVSDMKDTIRNTFASMGNALSGIDGPNWKL